MSEKYRIEIQKQDVDKLGSEFMEGKIVGPNELTRDEVNEWFSKIFPGIKPNFGKLTKVGGGKRKPKRKSRKSHKKKRKSKRKSRKSRKSRKTKKRRR